MVMTKRPLVIGKKVKILTARLKNLPIAPLNQILLQIHRIKTSKSL